MMRIQSYPQVKMLGLKTQTEMEKLYAQVDVVIVCSRDETLSMAAVEAMMHKKVCIVSNACGIVAYLDGPLKELVYPWDDADALAEKISWCIANEEYLPAIGEEGRKIYEQKFSMDAFAERLRNVFK